MNPLLVGPACALFLLAYFAFCSAIGKLIRRAALGRDARDDAGVPIRARDRQPLAPRAYRPAPGRTPAISSLQAKDVR